MISAGERSAWMSAVNAQLRHRLKIAAKQNHRADQRVQQALAFGVGQAQAGNVHHDRPRGQ